MNLADMLCYADIEQLTRIAEVYECECSSHSKNELIQTILAVVQRRDALDSKIGEMSQEDLRFLNSLLFETRSAYSLEELKARAIGNTANKSAPSTGTASPSLIPTPAQAAVSATGKKSRKKIDPAEQPPMQPEEAARHAITRFKRFGWLFNGASQQTRYLLQVPDDVKSLLCDTLERKFRERLQPSEEPSFYRDEQGLLIDDLFRLLQFVRDNDMPLTTDGALHKRQLGQLLELMAVNEEIPGKGGWRFGYGRRFRDYPDRISLLYDYAWHFGLLQEQHERLVLTEQGRTVADTRGGADQRSLYFFWLRLYKGPIPNLVSLVQWISRLGEQWVTAASLHQILLPLIRPYYYDTSQDVLEKRVLGMMVHLGLLRRGETEAREAVVRITAQGRSLLKGTAITFEDTIRMDGIAFDSGSK